MIVSILIPCHNEEKSIAECVSSCINQTSPADEIVVVNDGSTDNSGEILKSFGDKIRVVHIPKATGNKSYAQEHGLKFIHGDVFVTTDADTIVDKDFVARVREDFKDTRVAAMGGYVKSLKINWITTCRALEYIIGQNIHKVAQNCISFIMVIPGAAGAFRTDVFMKYISFDHDTLTEDLDFTYRLNEMDKKIVFDRKAIVYTQDPSDLFSYINQMRRWYGGGWQNLIKHFPIVMQHPFKTLELSLVYIEGLVFSVMFFLIPILNLYYYLYLIIFATLSVFVFAVIASIFERRIDVIYYSPFYIILMFINAWIFLEQFIKQVILRRKDLVWFTPLRKKI